MSSVGYQNGSYDYEKNNKSRQKPKIQQKSATTNFSLKTLSMSR